LIAKTTAQQLLLSLSLSLSTECLSAHLFSLTVLHSDSYLLLKSPASDDRQITQATRFFKMTSRLPLELQMIVCNRVFRVSRDLISTKDSEPAFRYLVHTFQV